LQAQKTNSAEKMPKSLSIRLLLVPLRAIMVESQTVFKRNARDFPQKSAQNLFPFVNGLTSVARKFLRKGAVNREKI